MPLSRRHLEKLLQFKREFARYIHNSVLSWFNPNCSHTQKWIKKHHPYSRQHPKPHLITSEHPFGYVHRKTGKAYQHLAWSHSVMRELAQFENNISDKFFIGFSDNDLNKFKYIEAVITGSSKMLGRNTFKEFLDLKLQEINNFSRALSRRLLGKEVTPKVRLYTKGGIIDVQ
ncbi:MAG: hypothetical protein ACTSRP_02035 [Candidatus Helarchaeota archaeon]